MLQSYLCVFYNREGCVSFVVKLSKFAYSPFEWDGDKKKMRAAGRISAHVAPKTL